MDTEWTEDCPICLQPLSYPLSVCPGSAHDDFADWLEWGGLIPDTAHTVHAQCMNEWGRRRREEHRRLNCPVCRTDLKGRGIIIDIDRFAETLTESSSESSSESSFSSSQDGMTSSSSPSWSGESFNDFGGRDPLTGEDVELAWLRLARFLGQEGRHMCCTSGTRCWVPAVRLAAALHMEGLTEQDLVSALPTVSYGYDRQERPMHRDFLRQRPLSPRWGFDRPVFELYWDRHDRSYYVSCLSINGDNCRCGAEERGADLRYIRWNSQRAAQFHGRMKDWENLNLLPFQIFAFHDAGARAGEEPPPWLLVSAVLQSLEEDREVAPDVTVHEFVWQCRQCRDLQRNPNFIVCAYMNHDGWNEYWVRATTIGWRRRHRYPQAVDREDIIEV